VSLTELEKMLAGELYDGMDAELVAMRSRTRHWLRQYNATTQEELERRAQLLSERFAKVGSGVWIEPPFYCDYGDFIELGERVYMNFNCTILDCHSVRIGSQTMFGPNVQVYAAYHPIDADERCRGPEYASPIAIGEKAWIGGGAIICPGVTIGDRTTIGAGSVVTKDIPANVFAAGNPCRVIRQLV